MNLLTFLVVLLLTIMVLVLSEEENVGLSPEEVQKLPIKKLRTMLWQRGLECKGCATLLKYETHYHLPISLENFLVYSYPPYGMLLPTHYYHNSKGCAEKGDFVSMLTENLDSPIIRTGDGKQAEASPKPESSTKDDTMDDLMENLKKNGLGGAKLFTAKDFEGLSPEEMSAKFSGKKTKKSSTPKSRTPKMKANKVNTEDADNIEL